MSRQALTAALALTLVSIAAIIVVLGPQWTGWPPSQKPAVSGNASSVNATSASPPRVNVTVRLVAVPGGAGVAFVNGGRVELPAVLRVARCSVLNVSQASKPGWEALNGTLLVRACRDTEVRLAWRRIYATVRFEGEGPFQLDGRNMSAPVAVKLPLYTVHNVTQLPYRRGGGLLVPLNHSLTLNVTGNLTVRLAWQYRCRGVRITSNVGPVNVTVNGRRVETPLCVRAPATLETGIEGPAINSTHRWWLGWYWVEEEGRRWWWSPGINGSKLRITRPANVTLHYVLGLKGLPYVAKVYEWPEPYFNGSCPLNPGRPAERFRVENGWLRIYDLRPCTWSHANKDVLAAFATMGLDGSVGVVEVEVYVPYWRPALGDRLVYVILTEGCHEADDPAYVVLADKYGTWAFRARILYDGLENGRHHWYRCEHCIKAYVQPMGFNMYGFVKSPDFWKYKFTYPCDGLKILRVKASAGIADTVYVRVLGVAPGGKP